MVRGCQRDWWELGSSWPTVSVLEEDGQLERGRQELSRPWGLSRQCVPVVSAGQKQGCGALMLWGGLTTNVLGRVRRWGWPHLSSASARTSLLWAFSILGMSLRTIWTKMGDEIGLKTTFSEKSQEAWGLDIRDSWSLRKSSCTRWVWTWISNVKLRILRVQRERGPSWELRSYPSVSWERKFCFWYFRIEEQFAYGVKCTGLNCTVWSVWTNCIHVSNPRSTNV